MERSRKVCAFSVRGLSTGSIEFCADKEKKRVTPMFLSTLQKVIDKYNEQIHLLGVMNTIPLHVEQTVCPQFA